MLGYNVKTVKQLLQEQELLHLGYQHLFGNLWLAGEICFLFGDSNTGKSLLAQDIAIMNAGGRCYLTGFMPDHIQKVVLFEYEMNEAQFAGRLIGCSDLMPENFIRVGFNLSEYDTKLSMLQSTILTIKEMQAQENPPKVFIIDNITFLQDTSSSQKLGIEIMKEFKVLKEQYGLSILFIGHCPKRKKGTPISQDSLGGSKMLMNFCDSAFAIGDSGWGPDTKYIKHIKSRSVARETDVQVIEIDDKPYLHFKPICKSAEEEHIGKKDTSRSSITPEQEAEILDLRDIQGLSIRDIAAELGLSKSAVGRFLKEAGI